MTNQLHPRIELLHWDYSGTLRLNSRTDEIANGFNAPKPQIVSAKMHLRDQRQVRFLTFVHEAAISAGYRRSMTAGNILGRASGRLRAAFIGALNVRAVTLACVGLGLAAVSGELFEVVRMTLSPSPEHQPAAQLARSPAGAAKIDLSAIASAQLIGSYAPANRRQPAPDGREDLNLSGILFFGGNNPLSRIMLAGHPNTSFAVGDRVTGDVVVGAIFPQYAILSDGGRDRMLRMAWDARDPGGTVAGIDNGNDDLQASDDDPSKLPPILEPYVDPVGDG